MIPLFDDIPSRRIPWVNYTLILLNVLVFVWEVSLGPALEPTIRQIGLVPVRFWHETGIARWLPVFTSMFLHGGTFHLFSNMLALWIFGDNVEDRMGHLRYLIFYLLCGVAAALAHVYLNPTSPIPTVGASGAISGVLAAYFVMFPTASVYTLIPLFFFWIEVVRIPAVIYLGIWFLSQLFNGLFALSVNTLQASGGVAWWAHVGGFVAGLVLVWFFRQPPERRYADEYWPW
ncbi:MAG: rhomboid family intramembrane serine protease [Ardenticatenia bacterium]|nr:MAG: rhomboid family intramembrane serine protease [Ardenticatenia bacterium]